MTLLLTDTLESLQAEAARWRAHLDNTQRQAAEIRDKLRWLDADIDETEHLLDMLRQAERELTP